MPTTTQSVVSAVGNYTMGLWAQGGVTPWSGVTQTPWFNESVTLPFAVAGASATGSSLVSYSAIAAANYAFVGVDIVAAQTQVSGSVALHGVGSFTSSGKIPFITTNAAMSAAAGFSASATLPGGGVPIPGTSNRPQYNSGTNVLSWSGPVGGGPSTGTYTPQTLTLTNSGAVTTTAANQVISGLNITGTGNGVVTIAHNNCTLRQCRVFDSTGNVSNVYLVYVNTGITGTIIEDCLLDQNSPSGGATGNSTIAGDESAGPGITGITVRRSSCTRSEQAIRFILNQVSFTENYCYFFGGADADWFECYPVGGTCNNLDIEYNTFDGGSGAYPGADSGINFTTGSGLPTGNIGPTITVNSNWFTNWVGVHAVNIDSSSGGFIEMVAFTNNGFTTNSLPDLGNSAGSTITTNSGNYVMTTPTSTTGAPLNGTGVY